MKMDIRCFISDIRYLKTDMTCWKRTIRSSKAHFAHFQYAV